MDALTSSFKARSAMDMLLKLSQNVDYAAAHLRIAKEMLSICRQADTAAAKLITHGVKEDWQRT